MTARKKALQHAVRSNDLMRLVSGKLRRPLDKVDWDYWNDIDRHAQNAVHEIEAARYIAQVERLKCLPN